MKKLIYIAVLLIFFAPACTEKYDVELDSTYVRLVVQGSISDELKAHQISLTNSADYFSNSPAPKVTDATVSISDGENTFDLTEVSDGLYETDTISGEPGKTYTLTINSDGETYTSSCLLNFCAPMDSINFGFYDYSDYYDGDTSVKDTTLYILLNALEPSTPGDFYLWNVYKNEILESDTLHEVYFSDDVFINGNYMYDIMVQWIEYASVGDTITLEMQAITEEYYDYIIQVMTETVWNMGPFDGPPANPTGNISNGAMGFFLAYSVETITAIVPDEDEWIELEWY